MLWSGRHTTRKCSAMLKMRLSFRVKLCVYKMLSEIQILNAKSLEYKRLFDWIKFAFVNMLGAMLNMLVKWPVWAPMKINRLADASFNLEKFLWTQRDRPAKKFSVLHKRKVSELVPLQIIILIYFDLYNSINKKSIRNSESAGSITSCPVVDSTDLQSRLLITELLNLRQLV